MQQLAVMRWLCFALSQPRGSSVLRVTTVSRPLAASPMTCQSRCAAAIAWHEYSGAAQPVPRPWGGLDSTVSGCSIGMHHIITVTNTPSPLKQHTLAEAHTGKRVLLPCA